MAVDYYREVDLVQERVVPPEGVVVPSSGAKEAVYTPEKSNKDVIAKASSKFVKLIGNNELVDGISVRYPPYMVDFFRRRRTNLAERLDRTSEKLEKASNRYYRSERKITSTIAGLKAERKEEFIPGLTYTAVSFMTGSVLTRNRNFVYRFFTPIILGTTCLAFVLPGTFNNVKSLCYDIEKHNFPRFVEKQDKIVFKINVGIGKTISVLEHTFSTIGKGVSRTQAALQEWTGLNV